MPLAELTTEEMAALLAATPAPSLKMKTGMTYPIQAYATDNNGPYDLSTVTAITFAMKGVTTGPLVTGTGSSQQVSFTATTANNNNQLTAVSSTSGLFLPDVDGSRPGSILVGPGIPPPVFNSTTNTWSCTTVTGISGTTVTMSAPATATASGVTVVGNKGLLQYNPTATNTSTADTYLVEWKLTTGGVIIFVPSESDLNQSIEIDASLGE